MSSSKITVIATKRLGKYQPEDEITVDKYAGRALVAMGKARFKDEKDDFRKARAASSRRPPRRGRNQRRDMTAEQ